jgi:hypothetical protein
MDANSIAFLASSAVHVLAPYLRDAGHEALKSAAGEAGKKAFASAVAEAKTLYEVVARKLGGGGAPGEALAHLEAAPNDTSTQRGLENELTSAMNGDATFAHTLAEQLVRIANSNADASFVNNISGDVGKLVQIGTVIGNVNL